MTRHDPPPDHWTPELVEERLIEAVGFVARATAGAGPAGYTSALPAFHPRLADFLEEGWGLPEPPDEDEPTKPARLTPRQVERHMCAIQWVADYLAPDNPGRARAVNAWIFARAYRRPFGKVAAERGLSRSFAYRLRDQGLSILSQRLQSEGVPPWPSD